MSAVIHYHTLYLVHGKNYLILSFALGDDISLHSSTLNLPSLLAMGATISLYRGTLACSKLHHTFILQSVPQRRVLLDGVSLDQSIHIVYNYIII